MNVLNRNNFDAVLATLTPGDNEANTSDLVWAALNDPHVFERNLRVEDIHLDVEYGLVLCHLNLEKDHQVVFVVTRDPEETIIVRTIVKRPNEDIQLGEINRPLKMITTNNNAIKIGIVTMSRLIQML